MWSYRGRYSRTLIGLTVHVFSNSGKQMDRASSLGAYAVALGVSMIAIPLTLYWYFISTLLPTQGTDIIAGFEPYAYLTFLLLLGGAVLSVKGINLIVAAGGRWRASLLGVLGQALSRRRKVLIVSAVLYGLLFAFLSGFIVYQPAVKFSEAYGISVPSMTTYLCCGPVGTIPVLVLYLADQVSVVLIPLNLLILLVIVTLVGTSISLTAELRSSCYTDSSRRSFLGLGSFLGLFAGCPTCSSILFSYILGGVTATPLTVALAGLQAAFLGATIPILLIAIYLAVRKIAGSLPS